MKNLRTPIITLLALFSASYASAWEYGSDFTGLPYEEGLGTEEAPFVIKNEQQLANLAYSVNNGANYAGTYFVLVNDLDLNPGITFDPDNAASYAEAKSWVPVGTGSKYFAGNFDGGGHTVKGLYLKGDNFEMPYSTKNVAEGLFGNIRNMTLSDLTISNSLVAYTADESESISFNTGFFASDAQNCSLINLKNEGNVRTYYTGERREGISTTIAGIVATANGGEGCKGMKGCENYGNMKMNATYTASYAVDIYSRGFCGIIGEGYDLPVSDCHNYGDLDGQTVVCCWGIGFYVFAPYENDHDYTDISNSGNINGGAGLFCMGRGFEMIDCYNTGKITNGCGLMNDCQFMKLTGCYNTGDVNDEECGGVNGTGGLIGYTDYLTEIVGCYNTGKISASQSVGGLIGCAGPYDVAIRDCYNEGAVATKSSAGGIVGNAYGSNLTFVNCHNRAAVSGGIGTGGIFGTTVLNDVSLDSCTNICDIEGKYNVGGLVGQAGYVSVKNSNNSGNVTSGATDELDNSYTGGLVGKTGSNYPENFFVKSYNTGDVTAVGKYVGGIAGESACLAECYNTGNVTGKTYVGGLSGLTYSNKCNPILNCYNTGDVTGEDFVAGLCSSLTGAAKYCFNYGKVNCPADNKALLWIYGYMMFQGELSSECFALPQDGYDVARLYIGGNNSVVNPDGCSTRTKEEFADGTVCWLLNADQEPAPWGQDTATDAYPLLNGKGNPATGGVGAVTVAGGCADGRVFTVDGRLVSTGRTAALPAGLYIIDGKKVLVK